MRITLGQQQQHRLPFGEHARGFVEQGDQLVPEQWHQYQQEHQQYADEQGKHQTDGGHFRHAQAFQSTDQPVHQKRQHQTGYDRRQHAAQRQDKGERQKQQNCQDHRLLVREVALHPIAKHIEHQTSFSEKNAAVGQALRSQ